jgi:pimeloyl-ACP methyl ester carboxylesterase
MERLPRRAFLGAELAGDEDAFSPAGMRIAGVLEGGMAVRANLLANDLVVSVAGMPVRNPCELSEALRRAGGMQRVEIGVEREDSRFVRTVDLVQTPREPNASYGEIVVDDLRLRTLATRVDAPRTLVVVLQGIACESIDCSTTPEAPLAALIAGWAEAGIDTLRFDKRGVGDSEGGPCTATDFVTELEDARVVVEYAKSLATLRAVPLVVFGHSVGSIIAAHMGDLVDGAIVYGAPVMGWLDCLLDSTRRQLALRGTRGDEIERELEAIRDLARTGDLNGRSAAYHQQLFDIDLEAAWQSMIVPVLVARGEYDWVVDATDQARITDLAPRAQLVDVPGLDHLFGRHADHEASLRDYGAGAADRALVEATLPWLDRLRSRT